LDYYDEINLLSPFSKTDEGHRLYAENDVLRLQQISVNDRKGSGTRFKRSAANSGSVDGYNHVVKIKQKF